MLPFWQHLLHVFDRFFVFVAFLATFSDVQTSWKTKCCLFGNIFEQTYPLLVIVCKVSAFEQICTTRFVRIQFFFIHTQFFFHFFSNSLLSNSFSLSSMKFSCTIQFLIKNIFTQQKTY